MRRPATGARWAPRPSVVVGGDPGSQQGTGGERDAVAVGGEERGTVSAATRGLPAIRAVVLDVRLHVLSAGSDGGPPRRVDTDSTAFAPLRLEGPGGRVVRLETEAIPDVHRRAVARGGGAV